ncbi:MAG: hypothetical protein ABEJ59_04730 [Halanaeroarchaeum sp.]
MTDGRPRRAVTIVLSLLVGVFAGRVLGPLFVPDPTGTLAQVLAVFVGPFAAGLVYAAAAKA